MVKPKSSTIKSNLIITEVQKRPCLYDSNYPEYADKTDKARAWSEVCEAVVPGWSLLGLEQKFNAGKEVQKRWRSIRDAFTKAYRQGKCVHPEQCAPGSRRFYHNKQMAFLLKALQTNRKFRYSVEKYDSLSEASNSPNHAQADDIPDRNNIIDSFEKPLDLKKPTSDNVKQSEFAAQNIDKASEFENQDKTALDILAVINSVAAQDAKKQAETRVDGNSILPEDHFDDDKMFLNSLIPMFKKMNDDTRLLCRIEVLKIIRYALQGDKVFESLKSSEDNFYRRRFDHSMPRPVKEEYSPGDFTGKARDSSLSIVTRSADGSRPVRKRRTRSPSPLPPPTKKRGPGRPRKIRPPPSSGSEQDGEEEARRRFHKKSIKPETAEANPLPYTEPRLSELDEKLRNATSIAQLETPEFMQIYNLERTKTLPQLGFAPTSTITRDIQVSVKTEPLDIEHHIQ